jgi:hypothetical protein
VSSGNPGSIPGKTSFWTFHPPGMSELQHCA